LTLVFLEQAGELLVIVLSLRGKNVIQFIRKTGPENHTHEANGIQRTPKEHA
jgi:hypothetical protein